MKHYLKKLSLLALSVGVCGCSSTAYSIGPNKDNESPIYVRDSRGQTVARIQDSNVYNTQGQRTHRIDSRGNIYATSGAQAGQRVGKIGK